MAEFTYRSHIEGVSPEALFDWHLRPGAFERLLPPWESVRVEERPAGLADGSRLRFSIRKGPLRFRWTALHRDLVPGVQFVDEQEHGPYARWIHTHRFMPGEAGGAILEDHVHYRLPMGWLGEALAGGATERMLERLFAFRHQRTREDLARHAAFARFGPQRVIITGATGLVGSALTAFLSTGGHRVQRLVRRAASSEQEIAWDPSSGRVELAALEGADAVVHLAGRNIADGRWSPSAKAAIRESRVEGTRLIARSLASLKRPPRVLVCASAIGFYGDTGEREVDERAPRGSGFLPEVCEAWEAAADPARSAGIRVVHLRIGVVLSARGGALARMLTPFRLGLGGVVGSGSQGMSWIALEDLLGAIQYALFTESLSGPVNAVAPSPATNREFTHILARLLRRPALLPLPAAGVRLLFGEMGQALLLESARVLPWRLAESGFSHLHPTLEGALRAELGR